MRVADIVLKNYLEELEKIHGRAGCFKDKREVGVVVSSIINAAPQFIYFFEGKTIITPSGKVSEIVKKGISSKEYFRVALDGADYRILCCLQDLVEGGVEKEDEQNISACLLYFFKFLDAETPSLEDSCRKVFNEFAGFNMKTSYNFKELVVGICKHHSFSVIDEVLIHDNYKAIEKRAGAFFS